MNHEGCIADRVIYDCELRDFLPDKIFDAHVHLFDPSCWVPGQVPIARRFYQKFGAVFTIEQWLDWTASILPEQQMSLNGFGFPSAQFDRDASARYSGKISDNQRVFGMAMVSPDDSLDQIARRVRENRLIGYKPYPDFVSTKDVRDVTIDDMLPVEQMQFAEEHGLAVTLHIPRPGRLADPLNQSQMVALCRRYPRTQIIFAHIGRAYYLKGIIGLLDAIAACPNAFVDTAMVNHEGVLEYAFRHFPMDRILFGSDAPIAFLRGKSVEVNNQYIYLMGEDYEIGSAIYDSQHRVAFTTFYYEQLRGIKLAAFRAGLSDSELQDIFYNNAHNLFGSVAARNYGS